MCAISHTRNRTVDVACRYALIVKMENGRVLDGEEGKDRQQDSVCPVLLTASFQPFLQELQRKVSHPVLHRRRLVAGL